MTSGCLRIDNSVCGTSFKKQKCSNPSSPRLFATSYTWNYVSDCRYIQIIAYDELGKHYGHNWYTYPSWICFIFILKVLRIWSQNFDFRPIVHSKKTCSLGSIHCWCSVRREDRASMGPGVDHWDGAHNLLLLAQKGPRHWWRLCVVGTHQLVRVMMSNATITISENYNLRGGISTRLLNNRRRNGGI